jgi:multidrug efflux system membrane fusion protein
MSKNLISASLIGLALAVWLGSGYLRAEPPEGHQPGALSAGPSPATSNGAIVADVNNRVRVSVISAESRTRHVVLRGRTESKRMVDVKAEIAGAIVTRPVERGVKVEKGDLLCEVAVEDRQAALQEARAALHTARIEYQGSLELQKQELLSDVAIANSQARLEAARAMVHRQELNLSRTRIEAPFSGVVENLHMNIGDYAVPGASCATLIDLDPMLITARVTEAEVDYLSKAQTVSGYTATGRELQGSVSFGGKQSDSETRTYPVEITVENNDYSIRSGLTVAIRIGVEEVRAHQVPPSLLTIDDAGEMGLRIVDNSNKVAFRTVKIIEDGADGMWITGLPGTVNLITVGQEYVAVGDFVEPVFSSKDADQLASL